MIAAKYLRVLKSKAREFINPPKHLYRDFGFLGLISLIFKNERWFEMAENLVVKAKLKDVCKGYNVAGDLADALNEKVEMLLKDAMKRAEANGRKTVMAKDL